MFSLVLFFIFVVISILAYFKTKTTLPADVRPEFYRWMHVYFSMQRAAVLLFLLFSITLVLNDFCYYNKLPYIRFSIQTEAPK